MTLGPDGYRIFPVAIPPWLASISRSDIYHASKEAGTWHLLWQPLRPHCLASETFRYWVSGFLTDQGIRHHTPSQLVVFDRQPGDPGQRAHDDSDGNPEGKGRAFVACYLSPTTEGRAPLVIIPGTQDGADTPLRQRCREARRVLDNVTPKPSQELVDQYADLDGPQPGELVLEVPARTIVVVDERVVHRVAPNTSGNARLMVLLWLHLITG